MARICSEAGCGEPHTARGLCHRHYRAFLRAGGARKSVMERIYGMSDEARFGAYVRRGRGCWEWTGYKNAKGYGVFNVRGERIMAHRFAYQLRAEIPKGFYVLHRCDNPGCVRPKHLFLGTLADNNRDMFDKGRGNWPGLEGAKNHRARLTEADVRAIRASSERVVDLAAKYGVARTHIHGIRRGLYWPSVT